MARKAMGARKKMMARKAMVARKKKMMTSKSQNSFGDKGKKGRQLHQHGNHPPKKDGESDKDGDKKDSDKKDVEPSAEFKAAAKACSENKLCKQLMECMKKHADSGGKGDGKGDGKGKGDHEEVCVEEMKACAADKECSLLHAKLLHYKLQEAKKDGGYGGKDGYGK